jgi:hypothetical protein
MATTFLFLTQPSYGMGYVGLGYEKGLKATTSANLCADYFFIHEGSANNSGIYNPRFFPSTNGNKHIYSIRGLYKYYPLGKRKLFTGLYMAGGVNFATRYSSYPDFSTLELYSGLGLGLGYRMDLFKYISLEISYQRANNAIDIFRKFDKGNENPIGIELLELSIGYIFQNKKQRNDKDTTNTVHGRDIAVVLPQG